MCGKIKNFEFLRKKYTRVYLLDFNTWNICIVENILFLTYTVLYVEHMQSTFYGKRLLLHFLFFEILTPVKLYWLFCRKVSFVRYGTLYTVPVKNFCSCSLKKVSGKTKEIEGICLCCGSQMTQYGFKNVHLLFYYGS